MNIVHCQNIVPNGSFEEFSKCPNELGDFYPLNWYSIASNSTPDLFSNCAPKNGSANPNWSFSGVMPYMDSSFVGILLGKKKTNYREYIGIRLLTKLKKDCTYIFKISIAIPILSRYRTNTLDIILSERSIFGSDGYTIIEHSPSISIDLDSVRTDGTWKTLSFEYIANGNENNLSIGNFKSKKQTSLIEIDGRNTSIYKTTYENAYIFIDDVQLYKYKEHDEKNITEENNTDNKIEQAIIINGIVFETGSSVIQNDQIPDLEKITELMLNKSELTIEILGYTDNIGNESSNKLLSEERAISVKKYLIKRGISESRIITKGNGSENPIADNNTEEGRMQNRRIEILIK